MRTNVQTTSLEAFFGIQSKLNKRERELLEVLAEVQPASDRQLAKYLKWEIGSVNGRRNALVEKGVVEKDYMDISETGRRGIFWHIVDEPGQRSLF